MRKSIALDVLVLGRGDLGRKKWEKMSIRENHAMGKCIRKNGWDSCKKVYEIVFGGIHIRFAWKIMIVPVSNL